VNVLGFDTATGATAVALLRPDGEAFAARHDPGPDERPGHATRLLGLVEQVLADAGLDHAAIDRIAVGEGPGSFTGLRIGVATARGLAQATRTELVGISSLRALAAGGSDDEGGVLAVIDARRGEAFAAAWVSGRELLAPAVLGPDELSDRVAAAGESLVAVGDGALRFRASLEGAGAAVPPDEDPVHRIDGRHVCRLGAAAEATGEMAVVPHYLRLPDAELRHRQRRGSTDEP
jgi:tRNA threonylcarbamoyladenosine biosynthesis protein TsaB